VSEYSDFEPAFRPILRRCQPATMTSVERIYALYKAVEYLAAARIPGDIVECGVWRGGSMMCAALTLLQAGDTSRRLYLYDTFEGMVPPDVVDVDFNGRAASAHLSAEQRTEDSYIWAYAPLEAVRRNMASTGYPEDHVSYVCGPVEQTIPATVPNVIALLRLDTDWYASTRHELDYLFPHLAKGGVLIIDDYGHWQGARRAVDEYLAASDVKLLLNRIDYTGRIGVRC
jgi:O-methyltransferase